MDLTGLVILLFLYLCPVLPAATRRLGQGHWCVLVVRCLRPGFLHCRLPCLQENPSTCPATQPPTHPYSRPPIHPPTYLSIYHLSTHPSTLPSTHPPVHKHLLSIYRDPGAVLGTDDGSVNAANENPCPHGAFIYSKWEGQMANNRYNRYIT